MNKWKLRNKQLYILLRYSVAKVLSYLLPAKLFAKDLWLVCERGTDARDNGYFFYKYLREKHPHIPCVYVITRNSPDYNKVATLGNVVHYGSLQHLYYINTAKHLISTHAAGFLWNSHWIRDGILKRFYRHKGNFIFLQHGVIIHYLAGLIYPTYQCDLFICSAKKEYEYVKNTYGHPDGVVQYTGLCRFDYLHRFTIKKQILLMPTWRLYLNGLNDSAFLQSDYYKAFSQLLTDPRLEEILEFYDYELIFYPHYEIQKFLPLFHSPFSRVKLAVFKQYDVQTLLKESALLITDYSSVFFDFAYMKKPLIYYQFDKKSFYDNHYAKGYFDCDTMGFGKVAHTFDELLDRIRETVKAGCALQEPFQSRINTYYELYDTNNSQRIFECICRLEK